MSLDVDLMVIQPVSVFSGNITHNLGKMASEVKVNYMAGKVSLYTILWRPEELQFTKAIEIISLLHEGLIELICFPEKYKPFNPDNGWGSYDGLVNFVREYHNACLDNPEAELRISR